MKKMGSQKLMRLKRLIPLISLVFLIGTSVAAEGFKKSNGLKIESLEPVEINGVEQWMLIRGNDLSNPVLLYLHGGPGHSLIPFAHVATRKLVDKFIVVYWDQRGAGLSYNEKIPAKTMNINQFIDDTKKVTEYLKKRFHKEKIYLLGHSWGSVLGTLVMNKYPEDYYAYIGVGQLVNYKMSLQERKNWLENTIAAYGTPDEKKALQGIETNILTQVRLIWKYGGAVHKSGVNSAEIMNNSPYYPEKFTMELYDKGYYFAKPLEDTFMPQLDFFKQIKELKVPVYFFCGRYDYLTPTKPVLDYFKTLKAPYKEIIWFEESAHRMDIEEPEKFQNTIMEIAEKQGKE